jgi:hypothetical protein
MPFTLRPYLRFPVHSAVTYNDGPFQGQRTVWNLLMYWLANDGRRAMRPGDAPSVTVTLLNVQRIKVREAVVRWLRGQEFAVENVLIEQHNHVRFSIT